MIKTILKITKWASIALLVIVIIFLIKDYQSDIPFETLKNKYADSTSKFMEIDGMQVHYKDEGNTMDTVPLILIHGTSSSLFTWDACTDEWKKTHRVVRFDLPAFALTGPNADNNYTFEYYVTFVNEVLEKLNIHKCYLAGNSLGGGIAWEFAYKYPDKVEKLILVDATGYLFKLGNGGLGFKLIKTLGTVPIAKNFLYYITPYNVVKKSVEGVYFDKSKIHDKTIEQYMDFMLRAGNRKALVARLLIPLTDGTEKIKTIKPPTLIIWGKEDALIPVECAYKFHKDIVNSQLVVLQNSGHIPMEENPEQVIPVVEKFISR
jgi:pimeloyl-ACP methyl ester carboxylesterase